jgi:oligopeptide transport system permease protein
MTSTTKPAVIIIETPLDLRPAHGRAVWLWSSVLVTIAALCVLLPMLIAIGPEDTDWLHLSLAPSLSNGHWLGTDAIGRDVLVRACYGGRLSLLIGLAASLIALILGTAYGVLAGYCGGFVESAMMRLLDVFSALPFLLLVVLLLTLFERSLPLLLAVIGGYVWMDFARVIRAETARLRVALFVLAAQALGASHPRIMLRHIVPNLLGLALVYLSLLVPNAILVESFLSFLGLSVDEPSVSWGAMLFDGTLEMDSAPWTLLVPAILLSLTLIASQSLGEAWRVRLDPRASRA